MEHPTTTFSCLTAPRGLFVNDCRIVVCTHVWADGPAQALRRYLNAARVAELLYIGHPLFSDSHLDGNGFEVYRCGEEQKRRYGAIKRLPAPVSYIRDILLTLLYVWRRPGRYDAFIAFNNLNAMAGLVLRWFGKVDKVVYYTVDYTPRRFGNQILNRIYHAIERIAAQRSDETWNLSERMIEGRMAKHTLSRDDLGPQKILPMGFWLEESTALRSGEYDPHRLVYMGHLLEKNGVQFVLRAVPAIVERIPDFRFLVIGDGEYGDDLKRLAKTLSITDNVDFKGYVEDEADVNRLIARSALAVALYERGDPETNWTYYADPGKLKAYLGMGVPVLLTDVPPNAGEIVAHQCGEIIDTSPESISSVVIGLMGNKARIAQFRENARTYSRAFDWQAQFDQRISELLRPRWPEG